MRLPFKAGSIIIFIIKTLEVASHSYENFEIDA